MENWKQKLVTPLLALTKREPHLLEVLKSSPSTSGDYIRHRIRWDILWRAEHLEVLPKYWDTLSFRLLDNILRELFPLEEIVDRPSNQPPGTASTDL